MYNIVFPLKYVQHCEQNPFVSGRIFIQEVLFGSKCLFSPTAPISSTVLQRSPFTSVKNRSRSTRPDFIVETMIRKAASV